MLIFLLGYMGCGKTSIGKKLAKKINFQFLDLDKLIEKQEKQTIQQIFQEKGEGYFREIETKVLEQTFCLKNTVVATGGGTPCFFQNIENINKNGISVFIDMPTKALEYRLKNTKNKRPLLLNLKEEEYLSFIEKQLSKRIPFYSKAKLTIDGLAIEWEALINKLTKKMNYYS